MLEIYKKVLTDFGAQCQAQSLSGSKITFTVFQLGDGEYTGQETSEELMEMTALKSSKQEFGISKFGLSGDDEDTIILTLIAENSTVNIGYNIREIGIFAKNANGTQGLYSVCVAKPDKPDWMPAYNGVEPVTLVYRDYIKIGNADNVTLDLNSGGLASSKMLEDTAAELRDEIGTPEFEDYTNDGADVPEARDAIAQILSDKPIGTLFSKVKAGLMGLVTLGEMRKYLVNNGLCTEPGKFFADAAYLKVLRDDIDGLSSRYLDNAGSHNAIYRGKNLGTSVTAAQYAAISAGTFEDLYIGDYWVINGVNWRIAAFDYYLNYGDTSCTKHHVVIVPDTCLYNHVMNDTNITTGGYVGSKMYTEGLEQAKTTIKAAFSGHVLSHRVYLTNAVTDGHPSAGAWCDSEVDLMNEQMVYGGAIFMPIANGSTVYTNYRVEKSQLPLFAHEPSRICNRATWWLRDVVTASLFANVDSSGRAGYFTASTSFGVRPAFCIC